MNSTTKNIKDIRHPEYTGMLASWDKYRLVFNGGDLFLDAYLKTFSTREEHDDFNTRKALSYVPAHAKSAVMEVKNAIFQRMPDIKRSSGTDSYQDAVAGKNKGVDRDGNTMNGFIGRLVLPDLLAIAKVGVYIDRHPLPENPNRMDTKKSTPYLYTYKAEDILSWSIAPETQQLTAVLLRDSIPEEDDATGLVTTTVTRYRHLRLVPEGVSVQLYDKNGKETEGMILNIDTIPFVIFGLSHSLLTDISGHQIALLNLASSDMNYSIKGNYPFYTEQFDPMADQSYVRQAFDKSSEFDDENPESANTAGEAEDAATAKNPEIRVGVAQGRRYPKGLNAPSFISPPTETLQASMEKQEQIKAEIKQLINLAVSTLKPARASAETKREDTKGLEAGLSYVGMELEYGERQIQYIWALYEHERITPAVSYPQNYSLRSEESRREEAKQLMALLPSIPSKTFQKETAKEVVEIILGHRVTADVLKTALAEIDKADVIVIDPEVISTDMENGLVSAGTASKARGYPEGDVVKAQAEQAKRAAAIVSAQSNMAARGADDLDPDKKSAADEKEASRQRDLDAQNKDKTRGEGK